MNLHRLSVHRLSVHRLSLHFRQARSTRWLNILLILGLLLAMTPVPLFAQGDQPDGPITTGDDNALEFGVWWVEDYPPAGSGGADLPATKPDALRLRNYLRSSCRLRFFGICIRNWPTPRWTQRYVYGNSNAWESDWKSSAAGGHENSYIDNVDLAYFAGHGSSSRIVFGVGGNTHDDASLTYQDAKNSWGTKDADWIGLAACNVLHDSKRVEWARAMKGLRLLMGFVTTMADVPHGEKMGRYIRLNYTMTQAWFRAADDLQPQNKIARVLAEERWMFNDRWYNHNSQDYYDNTYHYCTHKVGSEPARPVDVGEFDVMPVFAVEPLSLDEADSRWGTLVNTTGITDTGFITETTPMIAHAHNIVQEGGLIRVSETGQLILDQENGLYNYTNGNDLWVIPDAEALEDADGVMTVDEEMAKEIADQFLNDSDLMPADAQFYEVTQDTLTAATSADGISADSPDAILSEEVLSQQVVYSRIVSATMPATNDRPAQMVEFSVMGPGSKLKVNVAPQISAQLLSASPAALVAEAVDGSMGGYRRVQQPATQSPDTPSVVPILPFEKVSPMVTYLNQDGQPELETMFGLSPIPLPDIKTREITSNTLAYWEGPMGWEQDQLIPVHAIDISNELMDNTLVASTAYIPANPQFMAPLARIESANTAVGGDIPTPVLWGDALEFVAFDATKTLAEAGYDAALDYTPGSGDYIYTWYLDEVDEARKLGTGRTLNFTVGMPNQQTKAGYAAQTIVLEVRDIGSNRQPDRSYTSYPVTVVPPVVLPQVFR